MAALPDSTFNTTHYAGGMACPDYRSHYGSPYSKCPWCGGWLTPAPRLKSLTPRWPPKGYGTFNGLFTSPHPKTDLELLEQAGMEQPAPGPQLLLEWFNWPFPPDGINPEPNRTLLLLRHVREPLAR